MDRLMDLKHMMLEEVEELTEKEDLNLGDLDVAYKIVDVIKDIDTIMAMEGIKEIKSEEPEIDDIKLEKIMDDLVLSIDERSALRKAMKEMKRK